MTRVLSAVALAALALMTSAAQAASQSSATISGLNFTLIDLDPNDGITPSFSFLTTKGSTALTLSANDTQLGESDSMSATRPGTFSFTRDQLANITNADVSGSLSSDALSVKGAAYGPNTSYNAAASTGAQTSGYYYNLPLNLSLTANSLLLIDANIQLKAEASNPQACSSNYYYCTNTETATATASSSLAYSYAGTSISATYNGAVTRTLQANAHGESTNYGYVYDPALGYATYTYTTTPKVEEYKVLDESLRNVFSNSSNLTQSATFGLSVSALGQAMTQAIPEPGTCALMLQGLLLGGWLLRRSRRAV